jgi:hypothetical protein
VGIGSTEFLTVANLRKEGYLTGRPLVVEIGAQQMSGGLFNDQSWIDICASAFGVPRREFHGAGSGVFKGSSVEYLSAEAPSARDVWQWLGFDYAAIDVDGSPGAIPLDLNFAKTPGNMVGKADLVTNCGTTEHIVNQLNAFKVIHELTAVGGIMMHNLPAQGYIVHGLINYNPKFFWALSAANGYRWLAFNFGQNADFYPTPDDVIGQIDQLSGMPQHRAAEFRFADTNVYAVLQKQYDMAFVPPIDVPTGSQTDIKELKERYWTIFDQQAFHARIKEMDAERQVATGSFRQRLRRGLVKGINRVLR